MPASIAISASRMTARRLGTGLCWHWCVPVLGKLARAGAWHRFAWQAWPVVHVGWGGDIALGRGPGANARQPGNALIMLQMRVV